jgi:hypothetical protein
MKTMAVMGKITDMKNIQDGDIELWFECWFFEDNRIDGETWHYEMPATFDSTASTTIINSKIVTAIVDFANANGFTNISRKDVLIPVWTRG